MKNVLKAVAMMILIGIIGFAIHAQAGQVYDRVTFAGATNLVGKWTNDLPYSAVKLVRVCVENSALWTNSIAFVRITADGLYTQAIGTVATTRSTGLGAGVQATLATSYLKQGDIVKATGTDGGVTLSNTYTGMLEFEVQQH